MPEYNPVNEVTKKQYEEVLLYAKHRDPKTVKAVWDHITLFEDFTGRADFKAFNKEQAKGFKKWLENRVQSRYQSGLLEQEFAKMISDKTNWRKMLQTPSIKRHSDFQMQRATAKRDQQSILQYVNSDSNQQNRKLNVNECASSLADHRNSLLPELATNIQKIAGKFTIGDIELLTAEPIIEISYPVIEYPHKMASLSFDKSPTITGKLLGIKGQYLIFPHGVINIRSFSGYEVAFSC